MNTLQPWNGEFPAPGEFNLVIYSDGGWNQDTLLSGWALHGYLYPVADAKDAKIKKAKGAFTSIGYTEGRDHVAAGRREITKPGESTDYSGKVINGHIINLACENDNAVPVSPTHFIDAYGGNHNTTNNFTELSAMLKALELIRQTKPRQATILADSKYALEGLVVNLSKWEASGGVTSTGSPVKNWECWKLVSAVFKEIISAAETRLLFSYVPGHSGEPGNEKADYNANRAMILQRDEPGKEVYKLSDRKGYIQGTKLSSRLLEQRWWYALNDQTSYPVDFDDRHVYFFGNHGTEDEEDLIGKSTATAKVSILFTQEKEPVLELLGDFLKQRFYDGTQIMTLGFLENILEAERYSTLLEDKRAVLWDDPNNLVIRTPDKKPVLKCLRPTYLGFRLLSRFEGLLRILSHNTKGTGKTVTTDITDLCVTTTQQGNKKPVTKPTEAMDPPNKTIDVVADYWLSDGTKGKAKLKLKLGQDIPQRNSINAIGTAEMKIRVITWPEGSRSFRYGTLLEIDGDTLFTASLNSNVYELTGKL